MTRYPPIYKHCPLEKQTCVPERLASSAMCAAPVHANNRQYTRYEANIWAIYVMDLICRHDQGDYCLTTLTWQPFLSLTRLTINEYISPTFTAHGHVTPSLYRRVCIYHMSDFMLNAFKLILLVHIDIFATGCLQWKMILNSIHWKYAMSRHENKYCAFGW